MKHLLLICSAIAALATTLPVGDVAMARDNGRGGQQGDRGRGAKERGPEQRGPERRGPERRAPEPRGEDRRWNDGRRGEERRADDPDRGRRSLREEDGRRRDDGGRRYEDGPYPAPDARPARRGGYLPDSFRGGVVDDYQRFRLRPPPRGYTWVRVNGGFALVSAADGRVFDVIPD